MYMQTILKIPGFTDNVVTHLFAGLGAGFFAVCIGSPVDVVCMFNQFFYVSFSYNFWHCMSGAHIGWPCLFTLSPCYNHKSPLHPPSSSYLMVSGGTSLLSRSSYVILYAF